MLKKEEMVDFHNHDMYSPNSAISYFKLFLEKLRVTHFYISKIFEQEITR